MFTINKLLRVTKKVIDIRDRKFNMSMAIEEVLNEFVSKETVSSLSTLLDLKEGEHLTSSKLIYSNKKLILLKFVVEELVKRLQDWWNKKQADTTESDCPKVVIFDFDDTLFPTFYWVKNLLRRGLSEHESILFEKLDTAIVHILELALSRTKHSYIVSNGSLAWIKEACNDFLPKTNNFIFKENRIEVISARDLYERQDSRNPIVWKMKVFENIQGKFNKDTKIQLMSIGDGIPEIYASNFVAKKYGADIVKVILKERPTLAQVLGRVVHLSSPLAQF